MSLMHPQSWHLVILWITKYMTIGYSRQTEKEETEGSKRKTIQRRTMKQSKEEEKRNQSLRGVGKKNG